MNDDGLLGLDPIRVQRVADAYVGYGLARWRDFEQRPDLSQRNTTLALAASAFARAGEYYALYDADSSGLAFWAAATCFDDLGAQRRFVFAVCAQSVLEGTLKPLAGAVPSPRGAAAWYLYDALRLWRGGEFGEQFAQSPYETDESMLLADVAGTHTPLRAYAAVRNAIIASQAGRDTNAYRFDEWLEYLVRPVAAIISGAAGLVRRARGDRFHWHRLQTAVSPAPVEGLAAGVVYFSVTTLDEPLLAALREAESAREASVIADAARSLANARRDFEGSTDALRQLAARRRERER